MQKNLNNKTDICQQEQSLLALLALQIPERYIQICSYLSYRDFVRLRLTSYGFNNLSKDIPLLEKFAKGIVVSVEEKLEEYVPFLFWVIQQKDIGINDDYKNLRNILLSVLQDGDICKLVFKHAGKKNCIKLIKFLLQHQQFGETFKQFVNGETFNFACKNNQFELVKFLLDYQKVDQQFDEFRQSLSYRQLYEEAYNNGQARLAHYFFNKLGYGYDIYFKFSGSEQLPPLETLKEYIPTLINYNNDWIGICGSGEKGRWILKYIEPSNYELINDIAILCKNTVLPDIGAEPRKLDNVYINIEVYDAIDSAQVHCSTTKISFANFLLREKFQQNCARPTASIFFNACKFGNLEDVKMIIKTSQLDTDYLHQIDPIQKCTPLQIAIENKHVKIIIYLLSSPVFKRDKEPKPATVAAQIEDLFWKVCCEGNVEKTTTLINFGIDINQSSGINNRTPLYVACQNGHTEIAKILMDAGADLNRMSEIDGATPFWIACKNGHTEVVRILLKAEVKFRNAKENGITPFWGACKNCHEQIINLFLEKDLLDKKELELYLWKAIDRGYIKIAALLLVGRLENRKMRIDKVSYYILKTMNRDILLQISKNPNLNKRHFDYVKELIGKVLNDATRFLRLACKYGQFELVKYLISQYSYNRKTLNQMHIRALGRGYLKIDQILWKKMNPDAAYNVEIALTKRLQWAKYPFDIHFVNPFFIMCHDGNLDEVKAVIKDYKQYRSKQAKKDYKEVLTKEGDIETNRNSVLIRTPFEIALINGHDKVAKYLAENAKEISLIDYRYCSSRCSPYILNKGFINIFLDHLGEKFLPLSKKRKIFQIQTHGMEKTKDTLLHRACVSGSFKDVKTLVKFGAPLEQQNKSGKTPMWEACENGHIKIAYFLHKEGAKIHPEFLLSACKRGHFEIVHFLLKQGVNVNCTNSKNQTPLWLATSEGYVDIVILLLKQPGINLNKHDLLKTALSEKHFFTAKLLIEKGVKVNITVLRKYKTKTKVFETEITEYINIFELFENLQDNNINKNKNKKNETRIINIFETALQLLITLLNTRGLSRDKSKILSRLILAVKPQLKNFANFAQQEIYYKQLCYTLGYMLFAQNCVFSSLLFEAAGDYKNAQELMTKVIDFKAEIKNKPLNNRSKLFLEKLNKVILLTGRCFSTIAEKNNLDVLKALEYIHDELKDLEFKQKIEKEISTYIINSKIIRELISTALKTAIEKENFGALDILLRLSQNLQHKDLSPSLIAIEIGKPEIAKYMLVKKGVFLPLEAGYNKILKCLHETQQSLLTQFNSFCRSLSDKMFNFNMVEIHLKEFDKNWFYNSTLIHHLIVDPIVKNDLYVKNSAKLNEAIISFFNRLKEKLLPEIKKIEDHSMHEQLQEDGNKSINGHIKQKDKFYPRLVFSYYRENEDVFNQDLSRIQKIYETFGSIKTYKYRYSNNEKEVVAKYAQQYAEYIVQLLQDDKKAVLNLIQYIGQAIIAAASLENHDNAVKIRTFFDFAKILSSERLDSICNSVKRKIANTLYNSLNHEQLSKLVRELLKFEKMENYAKANNILSMLIQKIVSNFTCDVSYQNMEAFFEKIFSIPTNRDILIIVMQDLKDKYDAVTDKSFCKTQLLEFVLNYFGAACNLQQISCNKKQAADILWDKTKQAYQKVIYDLQQHPQQNLNGTETLNKSNNSKQSILIDQQKTAQQKLLEQIEQDIKDGIISRTLVYANGDKYKTVNFDFFNSNGYTGGEKPDEDDAGFVLIKKTSNSPT